LTVDSKNGFLYFTNNSGIYKVNLENPIIQTVNNSVQAVGIIINNNLNQVIWAASMDQVFGAPTFIAANDLTTGALISSYSTGGLFPVTIRLDINGNPFYLANQGSGSVPSWFFIKCLDTQCANSTIVFEYYWSGYFPPFTPCFTGLSLDPVARKFYTMNQCSSEGIWLQSGSIL
jgi:hypothetical protein